MQQAKQQAHPQSRNPRERPQFRQPERAYTDWLREDWDYIRFVNPGDLRVADKTCGTSGCHTRRSPKSSNQHDDPRRHAVGRGALQQRRVPAEDTALRRELRARRHAAAPADVSAAHAGGNQQERNSAVSRSAAALGDFAARQRAARVRARRQNKARSRQSRVSKKIPASRRSNWASAASAPNCAPIRFSSACRRRACSIRCCRFPAPTISPATIAPADARACHVIYANDRSPEHSGAYAQSGNHGTDRHRRSHHSATTNPAIRSATSSRARFRRASAWSATCIPARTWWPPISATPGGTTKWMASHVSRRAAQSQRDRAERKSRRAIPKARPLRGLWSDLRLLEKTGTPEFNQQLASTRSSPTSTAMAGSSAPSTSTIAKATCSTRTTRRSRSTIPTNSGRRCTSRTSISKKGCTASTATSSRTATATANSMARRATPSKSIASIATARFSSARTLITSGPAAPEGGTNLAGLRTPWQRAPFLLERRPALSSARWSKKTRSGKWSRCSTPSRRAIRTTARKSRLAKTIQQDGQTWGDVPQRSTNRNSRTPTAG